MSYPRNAYHAPSRFPNGVNNVAKKKTLGSYPHPDTLTSLHRYQNEFDTYGSGDWTVTKTSAAATQALTDADGGVLLLTNPANNAFLTSMQLAKLSFYPVATKDMWFRKTFKVDDATNCQFFVGLMERNTTPFGTVNNQIGFYKPAASTQLQFRLSKAGKNNHLTTANSIGTVANNTNITLGFHYTVEGVGGHAELELYVNDAKVYTYMASVLGSEISTMIPVVGLCPTFALYNGNAAGHSMSIDNLMVAKVR